MPELPALLTDVADAAAAIREAEDELEQTREQFRKTLRAARKAGASCGLLGKVAGLSRQRIARILAD